MANKHTLLRYYNFKQLAEELRVSEDDIEHYFKTGQLKKFHPENLNSVAPLEERDRISRLLETLNQIVGEIIDEQLLNKQFKNKLDQMWIDYRESNTLFARWLHHYGWEIEKIRIVIPRDEVERFKNELNKEQVSYSDSATLSQVESEKLHNIGIDSLNIDPAGQFPEGSDTELCALLKIKGLSPQEIARELKKRFPAINPSRVGRLITAAPGVTVTTDAYRKRGKKLLLNEHK